MRSMAASRLKRAARQLRWLVGYARDLNAWGRWAVGAGGDVDVWHAHDLPGLLRQLAESARSDWLQVSLTVKAPVKGGLGLHGSGMFVFNPPWTLKDQLQAVMPTLVKLLKQDGKATFKLKGEQR